MSDQIKHECGIVVLRLLKPLEYYYKKYGSSFYGLNKLYLLMEKQHNRGQDGAGIACVKFDVEPGKKFINRVRSNTNTPIKDIFKEVNAQFEKEFEHNPDSLNDVNWLKQNLEFTGELFIGHLRYGTFGKNDIEACHPFIRQNNWLTRNLVLAGNFNLTNVNELFDLLVKKGQNPVEKADTITILEKVGSFLDKEVEKDFRRYKDQGIDNIEITKLVAENLDLQHILTRSCKRWDGGYAIAGLLGHGDAFVLRDPSGIRPAFYYHDDEIAVITSERPVIQTALNVPIEKIKEIKPGHAVIIKKNGDVNEVLCKEPTERKACSFERIYFSRGTDVDIYRERKKLGELICPAVLKSIDFDIVNTVFSFIPNTAEVAYYGMVEGLEKYCDKAKQELILKEANTLTKDRLEEIFAFHPHVEKIAVKDAKLRTFITQDNQRDDLVAHVYDITYGAIRSFKDNLVVLDDSIVRGTTLKQSILRILDRLEPKKIVVVSSAPQIRYPDCYGIDMAKLSDFIAFQAAIELLKDTKKTNIIDEVYNKCKSQETFPKEEVKNHVKEIYKPFSAEQISAKISELLRPEGINAEVEIIYQSIENLHAACPNDKGDWYFTGDYPTPGGNKVVNKSFINYVEGKNERAY
ncbi:MAG: class II glutamine amidotransferase [Bacteroidota bacterium]